LWAAAGVGWSAAASRRMRVTRSARVVRIFVMSLSGGKGKAADETVRPTLVRVL
jgi:hypothetical protein